MYSMGYFRLTFFYVENYIWIVQPGYQILYECIKFIFNIIWKDPEYILLFKKEKKENFAKKSTNNKRTNHLRRIIWDTSLIIIS